MKRIFAVSAITVLLASLVLMPYPVRAAAEVWVDDDWDGLIAGTVVDGHTIGTDAFATIQDGIDAADETGTVNVAAGTYDENIIITARPGIKILGAGAAVTTINGDIDGDSVGDGSVVTGNNMNADSKIEGFTITGGVAPSPTPGRGGGLYLESSATTISSCNITGNSAIYGGGIYISNTLVGSKSPKVINCLVKDNGASAMGGGIFFYGATLSPTIMNSTIADNTGGDGIYNIQASTIITNTIVYGNSASDATNSGGTINISNSLIGTGTDPKFVGSGDYHLQSGSPAIDTGTSTGAPGNDLDGVFRPQGIGVDIGAFEYMLAVNYTLNLTIVGNGTVALDLAGPTYPSGTVVTLTANPGTGYVFDSWSGDLAGSTNPETITMDGDKTITATFTQDQYTLTIDTVGNGSVAKNPDQSTYTHGETVELIATADPGWSFDSWGGDVTGSTNPETVTMDGDKTITATFTQDQYTLTIDTVGNGSVAKNPDQSTYTHGETVELIATADPGWSFDSWGGDVTGSTNPETVTMDGDKTITATFTQDQYTLTVDTVGNGSVALDLAGPTYPSGTVVTLTANPGTGYVFDSWSGDLAGSTNPETITMDGDKSVIATFTESSQDKDTFQNFKISRMTINWAKDITKPDKKWGWRSFFSWFMRFTTKNADKFSISGRIKLPEGYTVAHLEESATVSVAINNSSGSDAVNFKEQILRRLGVRWTDTGKSPGENMKITKMTIWWAPEERDLAGWAGFNIRGELEFPESIGVNTTLAGATVTLTIPVSAGSGGGSLPGEEMVEFQVYSRSNQWSYYNSSLPFFRYEH